MILKNNNNLEKLNHLTIPRISLKLKRHLVHLFLFHILIHNPNHSQSQNQNHYLYLWYNSKFNR